MSSEIDPNAPTATAAAQPMVGGLGPTEPAQQQSATPASSGGAAGPAVIDSNQQNFATDVIDASQNGPIIVDFWAPWCEPCKTLGPTLEKLVKNTGGLVRMVKINIDENQELAKQMRIQSIPMVYAFDKGRPVDGFQGVVPDSQIREFIKKLVGDAKPPLEAALDEAAAYLEAGDAEAASNTYAQVLDADGENAGAIAGLIRCSIATKDFDTARAIIEGLTPEALKESLVSAAIAALDLAESTGETADVEPLLAKLAKKENDHQTRYDLAMAYYAAGQNQEAIDSLLEIIRRDRAWNDETARQQLLKIFEALGHGHELTMDGRRQLSSILFS